MPVLIGFEIINTNGLSRSAVSVVAAAAGVGFIMGFVGSNYASKRGVEWKWVWWG